METKKRTPSVFFRILWYKADNSVFLGLFMQRTQPLHSPSLSFGKTFLANHPSFKI